MIPQSTQHTIRLPDGSTGLISIHSWSPRQRFWRGMKLGLKINGIILLLALPFAVIEPFLFLIWGTVLFLILFLFIGPIVHWRYFNEIQSFSSAKGHCPHCQQQRAFKPYLKTQAAPLMRVHCESCGQTITVEWMQN